MKTSVVTRNVWLIDLHITSIHVCINYICMCKINKYKSHIKISKTFVTIETIHCCEYTLDITHQVTDNEVNFYFPPAATGLGREIIKCLLYVRLFVTFLHKP